jgi:hypothetical protein
MKWSAAILVCVVTAGTSAKASNWSDPSLDHSTKVTVSPQTPTPSDVLSVTVSRAVQGGWGPVGATVKTQGNTITVNVHWKDIYAVIAVYPVPWFRHDYTVSLGKLSPGTYVVVVANDDNGTIKDRSLISFAVAADGSVPEPEPPAGNLIDQLLEKSGNPDPAGQAAIDRLRGMLTPRPDNLLPRGSLIP